MSSILRDKSPALPSAAVLGAHAAMGRTRGKSLSPGVPEAHAGTDRLKRLLELIQSPRGQRRCEMPQFKREYQFYISVMVSTITSSLPGHRRPETEPAGVSSRSKTASLKSQKRANLPITISPTSLFSRFLQKMLHSVALPRDNLSVTLPGKETQINL